MSVSTCTCLVERLSQKLIKSSLQLQCPLPFPRRCLSGLRNDNPNPEPSVPPEGFKAGPSGEGDVRSWQINAYGGIPELQMSTGGRIPTIKSPGDVLIKVHAASVNPIDLAMSKGYGAQVINTLRGLCDAVDKGPFGLPTPKLPAFLGSKSGRIEFPLTLGRDFSGVVVDKGHGAGSGGLRIGDEVYGVVGIQRQGSQADYVVVSADTVRRKPKSLSFVEAASIPYVGLTTWSAVKVTGAFCNLSQKRFLVLGGSGGVGTFAVQYLKAEGANVVTTCSADAEQLMSSLGCDFVIDYKQPDCDSHIQRFAPYDCIIDLSGPQNTDKSMELTKYLKPITGQFITLSPPFLKNIDKHGLLGGSVKNLTDLVSNNFKTWNKGSSVTKWAFFLPNGSALEKFADLVDRHKLQPVIQQTFKMEDLPSAFRKLEEGHLRGKIVIDMQ